MMPQNNSIPLKMAQLHLKTTQSHLRILVYLLSPNYSQLQMFLVHKFHPVVAIKEMTVGFSPKMEHTVRERRQVRGCLPSPPNRCQHPTSGWGLKGPPWIPHSHPPLPHGHHSTVTPPGRDMGALGPNDTGTRERKGARCCRLRRSSWSQCPFRS